MAIPVVQASTLKTYSKGSPQTSIDVTKPAGVVNGELLLIIVCSDDNGSDPGFEDPVSGWTTIMNVGNSVSDAKLAIYWRIADGTEGATQNIGMDTIDDVIGWYLRVSGVDQTTPINVSSGSQSSGNSSSHAISGITTTVPDCLAFYALCFDGADGFPFSVSGTGWTETAEGETPSGDNTDVSGTWGNKDMAIAGATGTATIACQVSDGAGYGQFAVAPGITGPSVTDVETDEDYDDKDAAVTITGATFEAVKGTGKVEMGDNSDYTTANKVEQTTTSWADTAIDFTADLGAQSPGSKWLFVTNNSGDKNDPGFAVTVHRVQAFRMSASANIAASGEATTVQLTAPAGKTTADFDAGRIQDDENPADTVDITLDDYTEMEWCVLAKTGSREVQYDFRITVGGAVLDTYTVTPKLTIGATATLLNISGTLNLFGIAVKEPQTNYIGALTTVGALALQPQILSLGNITLASLHIANPRTFYTGVISSVGSYLSKTQILSAGSLSSAGILLDQPQKSYAGSITSIGNLLQDVQKLLAGTLTFIGAIINQPQIIFDGSFTPIGILTTFRILFLSIIGNLTTTGNLLKQVQKILSGNSTLSGNLLKQVQQLLSGILTNLGTLLNQVQQLLSGVSTSSGSLIKKAQKNFAGVITLSSVFITLRTLILSFIGTLLSSGILLNKPQKLFDGALTSFRILTKQPQVIVSGSFTSFGSLIASRILIVALIGTLTITSILINQAQKLFTGTIVNAGSLINFVRKLFSGSLTPVSAFTNLRKLLRTFTGVLALDGNLIKKAQTFFTGVITLSGIANVVKFITTLLIGGILTSTSVLVQTPLISLRGTLNTAGTLSRDLFKRFLGAIVPVGTVTKHINQLLTGVLTFIGTLLNFVPTTSLPKVRFSFASSFASAFEISQRLQYISPGKIRKFELSSTENPVIVTGIRTFYTDSISNFSVSSFENAFFVDPIKKYMTTTKAKTLIVDVPLFSFETSSANKFELE